MLEDSLCQKDVMPTELSEQIATQKDVAVLKKWVKLVATVDSIEQFIEKM